MTQNCNDDVQRAKSTVENLNLSKRELVLSRERLNFIPKKNSSEAVCLA